VNCIFDASEQLKWDKSLDKNELEFFSPEKKTCSKLYSKGKTVTWGVSSRDFLDKCMMFKNNGDFYRYSTYVPGSEKMKKPKSTVRGETLIYF